MVVEKRSSRSSKQTSFDLGRSTADKAKETKFRAMQNLKEKREEKKRIGELFTVICVPAKASQLLIRCVG